MEWMPIETAPRNGDRILVAVNDEARWVMGAGWVLSEDPCWEGDDFELYDDEDFLGWMPLPDHPLKDVPWAE